MTSRRVVSVLVCFSAARCVEIADRNIGKACGKVLVLWFSGEYARGAHAWMLSTPNPQLAILRKEGRDAKQPFRTGLAGQCKAWPQTLDPLSATHE